MIASSDRLWLSFGSGLLAAVNPCGFVLLPTYLMYFLGVSGRPGTQRSTVRRALLVSAALSAGFTFFRVKGKDSDKIAAHLMANRVVADAVHRDVGPVIRTAPGLLNDEEQIDRLLAVLDQAL